MRCLCMYPWKKLVYAQYYRMDFFHTQITSLLHGRKRKRREKKSSRIFSLSYMASDMTTSVNLLPLKKKTQRIIINFSVRCCLYTDAHSYQFFLSQCKKNFYLIKLEKRNKFHEAHKRKKKVTHSKSSHEWNFLAHKKK